MTLYECREAHVSAAWAESCTVCGKALAKLEVDARWVAERIQVAEAVARVCQEELEDLLRTQQPATRQPRGTRET